jgi:hypothetical protein
LLNLTDTTRPLLRRAVVTLVDRARAIRRLVAAIDRLEQTAEMRGEEHGA